MDGIKKRLKSSIRAQISAWISLAIILVSLVSGGLSFAFSFFEAYGSQDDTLLQFAALINQQWEIDSSQSFNLNVSPVDHDAKIILQPITSLNDATSPFNSRLPDGFSTVKEGNNSWRVFVITASNGRKLAIAQNTALRNEVAIDGALRSLTPPLLLMPILLFITNIIISRMFRPLRQLSEKVSQSRSDQPIHLSQEAIPDEIKPFVDSINQLINRLYDSVEQQKRFIANAAHELRTPITALTLQAESIDRAGIDPAYQMKFKRLREGLLRSRMLLEQLLTHARMQNQHETPPTPTSLMTTVREVMADMIIYAQRKEIDIGLLNSHEAEIPIAQIDLYTMLKNLIDNAIRYTPEGGKIDISIKQHTLYTEICVSDSGSGIPEQEMSKVLEPFYRGETVEATGSGLGLSIIQTIAQRINAKLVLKNRYINGRIDGLNASLLLPV